MSDLFLMIGIFIISFSVFNWLIEKRKKNIEDDVTKKNKLKKRMTYLFISGVIFVALGLFL